MAIDLRPQALQRRFLRWRRRLPPFDAAETIRGMGGRGVFMLSFTRTGSSLFGRFIGSHPNARSYGEVLNEASRDSFFRYVSNRHRFGEMTPALMHQEFYAYLARRVAEGGGDHCLFDLKLECLHMVDGNWRMPGPDFKLFTTLLQTDAPVILVERNDMVGRHLSSELAAKRQRFHSHSRARGPEPDPFLIDLPSVERDIAIARNQYAFIRTAFAGHPRFAVVTLEEMLVKDADGQKVFAPEVAAQMATLLGIEDRFDRKPALEAMAPADYRALILNYDAVEDLRQRVRAA